MIGDLLTGQGLHYSYVYYTQIMQAETLASAYRLWRRNWKGRGKEYTAGALVWQVSNASAREALPRTMHDHKYKR